MKKFVESLVALGPMGVFLIAVIDGVGVPIPGGVDALLVLLTAKSPDQAYYLATITTIGSLIGGMILYFIARTGGEAYLAKYTSDGKGRKLKEWFLEYGLLTVFIPALVVIPMPLKIAEICAGALGVSPMAFFLTLLAARIPRFFGLAYLGSKLGEGSWPWVKAHAWHMAGFSALLFVGLYLLILIAHKRKDSRRGRQANP